MMILNDQYHRQSKVNSQLFLVVTNLHIAKINVIMIINAIIGPSVSIMLNMKSLEVLDGRGGRKVRVVESIGSEWEEVAKALDMGQEDIDMIKSTHSDNDEEACREMLATWLEGNNGEVSWAAVTHEALIDAGLPELANSVKDVVL